MDKQELDLQAPLISASFPSTMPSFKGAQTIKSWFHNDSSVTNSDMPNSSYTFFSKMASVSLHRADRMRFLGFPPEILNMLRDTIKQSWPLGIQLEKPYGGSHEYVLWGFPWDGKGQAGIEARRLVRNVLAALYGAGWILIFSTDVSKKETDKDTMIFRHQMPPPPPSEWISIAFSQFNMVRLIDVPPDLSWELHNALTIARLRREPHQYSPGVTEIALNSSYWYAEGSDTMLARQLILQLVLTLEQHGFTVYASVDQKNTYQEHRSETDTWHLCRPIGWKPGMPVFHR